MNPGDPVGRLGRVPADSPCSCIGTQPHRLHPARLPRHAGLCVPSQAELASSPYKTGPKEEMGKRLPYSPRSSLGGGIREEWDWSLPTSPSDPLPLAGGCGSPPQPSKIQRREEKNEVSEDED